MLIIDGKIFYNEYYPTGWQFQSRNTPDWLNLYLCGAGMEMYTDTLSHGFVGMTFPEAAE